MYTGSQQQSSLLQCAANFQYPYCIQLIFQFAIDTLMLLILTWIIIRIFRYQGFIRVHKTKTNILILLWFAIISQFFFVIVGTHFVYYLYILFDAEYFICIVYYFIKKFLKIQNLLSALKITKIIICVLMLFFLGEFIYSNSIDITKQRSICGQTQYTFARVLTIIISLLLMIIGWFLYKSLIKKLQVTEKMTLNDRNRKRLNSTKQDIVVLLYLILAFLISQTLLLFRVFYFLTHQSNQCKYIVSNNAANIIVYIILNIFSSYLTKIFTMRVFGYRTYFYENPEPVQIQMISRTQQIKQLDRDSILIRKYLNIDEI